jgi:hypothetical protein
MSELAFLPVSPERVEDLTGFCEKRSRFGNGKFAWCSCMRWRMPAGLFQASNPAGRTAALVDLVSAGIPVGVLAYDGSEPIGWCSVAPRETYTALERSRILPRIDDSPVWSVACFFVNGRFRRQGLSGCCWPQRSATSDRRARSPSRGTRSSPGPGATPTWAHPPPSPPPASATSPPPDSAGGWSAWRSPGHVADRRPSGLACRGT